MKLHQAAAHPVSHKTILCHTRIPNYTKRLYTKNLLELIRNPNLMKLHQAAGHPVSHKTILCHTQTPQATPIS